MLTTLAIRGYRSIRELVLPLEALTVVTGANGTGKSNLYRALQLVTELASGRFIASLARAGGLSSVLWAGPEHVSSGMRRGDVPVQGTGSRKAPISLSVGFASDDLGYLADIGLPPPIPMQTMFGRDPELKREHVWSGPVLRPAALLIERRRSQIRLRGSDGWQPVGLQLGTRSSLLSELADPTLAPELLPLRHRVRGWRCHDSFRVDAHAPARQPCPGTFTQVLADDGHDLAPAVQTILESAWAGPFHDAIANALDGSRVEVTDSDGWFGLVMHQRGMLRPLSTGEWSDGTLRFGLLAAALLSPDPPALGVINEPEASLHPDLMPALAGLVAAASDRGQVLVVTHSAALAAALGREGALQHELVKSVGETTLAGQGLLSRPAWEWGKR